MAKFRVSISSCEIYERRDEARKSDVVVVVAGHLRNRPLLKALPRFFSLTRIRLSSLQKDVRKLILLQLARSPPVARYSLKYVLHVFPITASVSKTALEKAGEMVGAKNIAPAG